MYVGLAVRTALAIGINRSPPGTSKKDPEVVKAETRTWWYVTPFLHHSFKWLTILTGDFIR